MLIYKSRFLVRGEVWFDHEPETRPVDWILYRQRSRPVPGARWRHFHTLLIDLSQSPDALLDQMSKSTATKMRRARDKDRVVCERLNPGATGTMGRFVETYNRFASTKGLDPLDRSELDALAERGLLELSVAKDQRGEPLVHHAYYRDSDRSCFLHSASLHRTFSDSGVRNAIGRANVYLIWSDLLRQQAEGVKYFDFGGWYPGKTDQQLLGVNRFKEGFGGQVVRKYNCERILSVKGWVVLTAARILNGTGGPGASLTTGWENTVPAPALEPSVAPAVSRRLSDQELGRLVGNRSGFDEALPQANSDHKEEGLGGNGSGFGETPIPGNADRSAGPAEPDAEMGETWQGA